jgi:outer membrane lipoprotein SlyB
MIMLKPLSVLTLGVLMGLAGCANSDMYSGDVYSANQAKSVQTVSYGTITATRPVKIQGDDTNSMLGTVAGGVLGGVLGNSVGGGTGRNIATVAGALGGAAAGKVASDKLSQTDGVELEIKKENGESIVVVQKADPAFVPGKRVKMIQSSNGKTNVALAN